MRTTEAAEVIHRMQRFARTIDDQSGERVLDAVNGQLQTIKQPKV